MRFGSRFETAYPDGVSMMTPAVIVTLVLEESSKKSANTPAIVAGQLRESSLILI